MTPRRIEHPWYSYRKLLGFDALIYMLCGGRGLGKTYGAKKKGIKDAIRKGEEFIYLRRTVEEIKASRATFFSAIQREFPNHDFRLDGNKGQITPRLLQQKGEPDDKFEKRKKRRQWQTVCHLVALSTAQNWKGADFPNVTWIVFDEFIIEKSSNVQYLRNEVEALINFLSTVDRNQDRVRLLMLSNTIGIMNPYFTHFGISPDEVPEFSWHGGGDVVVHFPDAKAFKDSVYSTRFGSFIAREMGDYASYAVDNQFRDAHDKLIAKKTSNARYKYTVETSRGTFSVWYDMRQGVYFVLSRRPGQERILTFNTDDMEPGKYRVDHSEPVIAGLRGAFNRGRVLFESPHTRNAFTPIFDRKG